MGAALGLKLRSDSMRSTTDLVIASNLHSCIPSSCRHRIGKPTVSSSKTDDQFARSPTKVKFDEAYLPNILLA